MKDRKGFYYYPFPQNKHVRMYVRKVGEDIEFRLWNQDDPQMWKRHGWVSYEAIRQASDLFQQEKRKGFDPDRTYDITLAKELLNI